MEHKWSWDSQPHSIQIDFALFLPGHMVPVFHEGLWGLRGTQGHSRNAVRSLVHFFLYFDVVQSMSTCIILQ